MPLLLLAVLTDILLYADFLFYINNFLLHEKGNYVHAHMCTSTNTSVLL